MATVLSAGDIAVVGKRSSDASDVNNDSFAFVALRDIDAGTVINFTDKEWYGGQNGGFTTDNVREGVITYTASDAIAAGTVITVNFVGTETGMAFPPAVGDQIIAFQGSVSSPTVIAAFQDRGEFTASGQGTNDQFNSVSELPRGLTEGVNAIALAQQPNNATHWSYVGPTSGSQASLLQAIHTDSNWTFSNNPQGVTFPSTFTVGAPPPPAEIDVRFGTTSIPDGDTTPTYAEGTVFGSTPVLNGTVQQTFTILNQGGEALSVGQITITGANAGDFSITTNPSSSVAGSGSTTFTITFDPSAGGLRTATVNIANNDSNENPYNFDITGSGSVPATSPLGAGDVAFVGFNGDATFTTFAFVLLEPVVAGTVIKFTDAGWDGNGFKTGEFAAQWTAPGDLPFGTVVRFDEANPGPNFQPFSDGGYFTGGRFHLDSNGDQLFAYTGSPTSPTFLAGLHTDSSAWDTSNGSNISSSSQLPPQLIDGQTAISFGNGATNFYSGVYSGSTTGDQAALLAKINNEANWQGSASPQTLPSGTFGGGANQPAEIDVQYAVGGAPVADGDASPSAADGTQFDAQNVNGQSQSHTFIIRNLGDQQLDISQVTVTGAHAGDFTVTLGSNSVGATQQTTLTVTFDPSAAGARNAVIHIASNDSDEADYDFAVRGSGRDPAQTFTAGDVAFAGFDSNQNQFAFVLMENVEAGASIKFTDGGWNGTTYAATEGATEWVAPTALRAGTVVVYDGTLPNGGPDWSPADTGYFSQTFNPDNNGDQIIAYQGTASASGAGLVNIGAIHYDSSTFDATYSNGTGSSQLPSGLVDGQTAISFGNGATNFPYGYYNGPTNLPFDQQVAALNDENNWIGSNSDVTFPAGPIGVQPNTPPEGADGTITILEDGSHVFTIADFGYSDADGDDLLSVTIDTVTGAGSFTLNGAPVSSLTVVTAADITAGRLIFTPAPNANGVNYGSFTFTVRDDGGTPNGGSDTDATPNTITIDVTSVNDAPSGANKTVTTLEDNAYTFNVADFGFSDASDNPANALSGVVISSLPMNGTLTNNGVAVMAGQTVSAADIQAGRLVFTPAADANGTNYASFLFRVQDNGGTANGGVNTDQSPNTITVDVTPVNDAPSGANHTATLDEDGVYVVSAADFGFSDPEGNSFESVVITTAPGAGQLLLDGDPVGAGDVVTVAQLNAGQLTFVPAPNANGAGYTSFQFQVRDTGGSANGGQNTDQSPNTFTFDVRSVNDAPSGADKTVVIAEDGSHTFTINDFGFSDVSDTPGNTLQNVIISSLPGDGALTLDGAAVTLNQSISAADITGGKLVFTPDANGNGATYASFDFRVQDNGGTANNGQNTDQTPNTISIAVTPVNDAPSGADATISVNEDGSRTFTTSDFGFTDAADGDALLAVRITTTPYRGTLTLNDVPVVALSFVSAADIAAGKLVYTPPPGVSGEDFFLFNVQDDGGTANGGVDRDRSANVIDIVVDAISHAPSGMDATYSVLEDGRFVLEASDFGFSDVDGDALTGVRITTVASPGSLTLDGVAVTAGQVVSVQDINDGKLFFTPVPDANGSGYSSFTFQVQDSGSTANGGTVLDQSPNTIRFDVTPVSDAPSGADKTISMLEDASRTLTVADFGFTDPADGDAFTSVTITTKNTAGSLTLNGAAVASGDVVSVADIAAGKLVFTPAANANGAGYASFTFQVQDDGPTVNPGENLDPTPNTITFDVTPVSDAPAGADKTITMLEDGSRGFSASDFGFSDVDGDSFAAVKITSLPTAGRLTLDGAAVSAGQEIAAADISGLVFKPAANANGANYASFTFQLRDDGSSANGGVTLDQSPNTITLNITPVSDAPAGADKTVTVVEDGSRAFSASDFGFSDVDGDQLLTVRITSLPTAGRLTLDGVAVARGQEIAAVDIPDLVYKPAADGAGAGYASFTFQVRDTGSTSNGGVTLDQTPNRITVNVTPVDDGPIARPDRVSTNEATALRGDVFANNGSGADVDIDGPPLRVARVNGSTTAVGTEITLASGALLTLNANGTFEYDPNGMFDALPSATSGSSVTSATDTFRYTLAGGTETTVTVTIGGRDSDDVLRDGGGPRTLTGGVGDDVYLVNFSGDMIREAAGAGGGKDAVIATVNFNLATSGQNVEILYGRGTGDLTLAGDANANLIAGTTGDNHISGGGGADTLRGGAGDDTYVVRNAGVTIIEQPDAGRDRVESSVSIRLSDNIEVLQLTGNGSVEGLGNRTANVVAGNSGDNLLNGGRGDDVLTGRTGADTFAFSTVFSPRNVDHITDFRRGEGDQIQLSKVEFSALKPGDLPEGSFVLGTAAQDRNDHIIYDRSTGSLFYDADGKGGAAAVRFAILDNHAGLTADDIDIV